MTMMQWLSFYPIWLFLLIVTLAGVGAGALVGKKLGHSLFIGTSLFILAFVPIPGTVSIPYIGLAHFDTEVVLALAAGKELGHISGFWEVWGSVGLVTFATAFALYLLRVWAK